MSQGVCRQRVCVIDTGWGRFDFEGVATPDPTPGGLMERQKPIAGEHLEPAGKQEFKSGGGDYNNNRIKKVRPEEVEAAQDVSGDGSPRENPAR